MKEINMYKDFKQQCRMENIDTNEFLHFLIMRALCEPDIKLAEANAKIEYLSKKIIEQEQYNQELRDDFNKRWEEARKFGYDTGFDSAKSIYDREKDL